MMSSSTAARPSDQEIIAQFNSMKQELKAIAQKIGELELERDEHQLVVDTMSPLDGSRKCFRLVGGVLVERTVKDVLPAVQQNQENITTLIKQLSLSYKKKEDDATEFQKKYNIKVKA
ncbi:Prefoldin [Entophlyctis helioformis]|nr:Prefoldin [Entophlyctis helioformis]